MKNLSMVDVAIFDFLWTIRMKNGISRKIEIVTEKEWEGIY